MANFNIKMVDRYNQAILVDYDGELVTVYLTPEIKTKDDLIEAIELARPTTRTRLEWPVFDIAEKMVKPFTTTHEDTEAQDFLDLIEAKS